MTSTFSPQTGTARDPVISWLRGFLFQPVPLGRISVLRIAIYLFVIFDVFAVVNDVIDHAGGRADLYKPVLLRQWLNLPPPSTGYAHVEQVVLIIGCLLCASQRLPSWAEWLGALVVAAAFTDWVSIGFSYGKVDHDHFALITALWVLPAVGAARRPDRTTRSEAAGWALLCIQMACVATYFFSAWAKVRFGGWDWVTGSTFAWAMTRRGTGLGRMLVDPPWILVLGQISVFTLELCSPLLLFLRGYRRYLMVATYALFHLATYLTLRIHFLPLVICLLAFLPLERLTPERDRRSPR